MASTPPPEKFDITQVSLEEEMKRSYLDYAMSVIVSRALPDVRDGLKPVHRRILYAMNEGGYHWNRSLSKSSRIIGDVMGKYHPHGDTAIYDAMVRMAQDFSMRLPLVQGQGNFGSMDGDSPAAMRYTEARLARVAHDLLEDIDKDTVDFQPNYDEKTQEPTVLPARFPNLLVNGAGGIAVGMATNIPPHNLGEVIDATCAMIDNPEISIDELNEIVPGPDFPTGGIIMGKAGIRAAYHFGRGSVKMRGRATVEEIRKDREAIVITEVPYQVNKARMVARFAELVREKRIEGVSDIRDESDRNGVRVVVELQRGVMGEVVLNQLYRYTPLQTSFGVNTLALNHGRPEMLSLRDILVAFVAFREEVIRRRTEYELRQARDRAHVLVGLAIAVANIDPVIELIRAAPDPVVAREQLMSHDWPAGDVAPLIELIADPSHQVVDGRYRLSETQARAILELRLQRLTGLERDKIAEDLKELATQIEDYLDILRSRERVMKIMRDELVAIKDQYATPRRTALEDEAEEYDVEDLIQSEDMVVTVTYQGYIKRVPLSTYRAQRRGGKGRAGMRTKEEDFVSQVYVCNTHTPVLFFSSRGIVYRLKVYRLPEGTPQARGKALVNLLPLEEGETITTVMPMPEDEETWGDLDIIFATTGGNVRRNRLSDFTNIKSNGKVAMKFADDSDRLIGVATCGEDDDILLSAQSGRAIRFAVSDVRVFTGRTSNGVRGIRLTGGDEIVSMSVLRHIDIDTDTRDAYIRMANARRRTEGENGNGEEEQGDETVVLSEEQFNELSLAEQFILSVTENGFGKRTSAYEYRVTGRGGQGIASIETSERNGPVVASFPVSNTDEIVLVTNGGQMIRSPVNDIRIAGRRTQGVKLFDTSEDEVVVSCARHDEDDGDDGDDEDSGE